MNYKLGAIFGSLIVGAALMLGACAKSGGDNGGGGGTIAQTPCNAPQGNCNPSVYGQDPSLMIPQAYVNGYNNGYCGCQASYRPIYNSQWGFACAPSNTFNYSAYVGYNYGSVYQPQNNTALTTQQVYYTPLQYGGQTGSCYNDFAMACDVRVTNSCANGGLCRPVGGGSAFGVCTQGTGVDSYNTGYNTGYNGYSNYNGYNNYSYPGYNNYYYPSYNNGIGAGGYYNGNCKYRTTSWGLSYYYCL